MPECSSWNLASHEAHSGRRHKEARPGLATGRDLCLAHIAARELAEGRAASLDIILTDTAPVYQFMSATIPYWQLFGKPE